MLQAQTYSNVLDLAFMLPISAQKRLIRDVQAHVESRPCRGRKQYASLHMG